MGKVKETYINRDISWLYFNDRVLQEAANHEVPLEERVKFLGIFSNNLDEFFRVRVATIRRMMRLGGDALPILHMEPRLLLKKIQEIVIAQQEKFNTIYHELLVEMEKEGIFMHSEKTLSEKHFDFVMEYFLQKVRPSLVPIMLSNKLPFPELKDKSIYLSIKLHGRKEKSKAIYALIEVPTEVLPRIVELPKVDKHYHFILLDDIIRFGMKTIFAAFQYEKIEAYTIKITRDAELDISEDISESFVSKISQSLQNRRQGHAVRFLYDRDMPKDLLEFILNRNNLVKGDNVIAGGRYHNFKDFIKFPQIGGPKFRYAPLPPLDHPDLRNVVSLLAIVRKKDILLHFPFQAFHHLLDLLREAAISPHITSIKMTLYRVADNSRVINALISAAKNGKRVTVVIEIQARFDEENNIYWARRMEEEGIRVIFGVPGLKVHAKLLLIKEKVKNKTISYAHIGTGNFHEGTARVYTDLSLITCNPLITNEVQKVFAFFKDNYKRSTYRTLLVSPLNSRRNFLKLIETEIKNAKGGKKAFITIKINNLVDEVMIDKLIEAAKAGVRISLIVRGACAIIPQKEKWGDNISVTSIVDRFLEHTRIFMFCNGGDEKIYISSADWMARNLDTRIEISAPILDKGLQKQIKDILEIYVNDNVKARIVDRHGKNKYVKNKAGKKLQSQVEIYNYYQQRLK